MGILITAASVFLMPLISFSAVASGQSFTKDQELISEPSSAHWSLLTDGEARPSLPKSSSIERLEPSAQFRFFLEKNDGEKLGPIGFVRAETRIEPTVLITGDELLGLRVEKSDPDLRVTIYLRSSNGDVDLQYVTDRAGDNRVALSAFRFVRRGSEVSFTDKERERFLSSVDTFGLQIARSVQVGEKLQKPFSGHFGLSGSVKILQPSK